MQNIHVSRNGKVEGPYSLEVIREKALVGELSSADWAWWKGQTKWASLKSLPGLQFPTDEALLSEMDTEAQQDPGPIPCFEETQPAQHHSREETSSADTSEQTDETDRTPGITVPNFRIECSLWISAGTYWIKSPKRKGFLINFVAFLPVLGLFISTLAAQFYSLFAGLCFAIFIPAVVAPWSWIIMEQFRHHPVRMTDLFSAYFRAPLSLVGLGLISQLPFMLPLLSLSILSTLPILFLFWLIIHIFIFFSANLLVDKRISLLNSIAFSFQAVKFKFFSMLLYLFLISFIAASGFFLSIFLSYLFSPIIKFFHNPSTIFTIFTLIYFIFFVFSPLIFTILFAYASSIFAYLWVFSRDSLPNSDSAQQSREPVD
ncbi:MAG: hypothetical protein EOM12_13235, partial [Verrucomicrobiae bacterium]|nr:hypothetical protein [Verrucomicrobiae bacterium]